MPTELTKRQERAEHRINKRWRRWVKKDCAWGTWASDVEQHHDMDKLMAWTEAERAAALQQRPSWKERLRAFWNG